MDIVWEAHDGDVYGYADGYEIIVNASSYSPKWGESDQGRFWTLWDDDNQIITQGREKDLRAAKKAAVHALNTHAESRSA